MKLHEMKLLLNQSILEYLCLLTVGQRKLSPMIGLCLANQSTLLKSINSDIQFTTMKHSHQGVVGEMWDDDRVHEDSLLKANWLKRNCLCTCFFILRYNVS